ncbi:MAG: hypothetical protein AABY66_02400, partial [Nitrospirota bacterium]
WFALAIIFLITIFILFIVGRISRLGNLYIFSLFLVTIGFLYQVFQVSRGVERPGLFQLFKSHIWIGIIVLIGILSDLLIRSYYAL